MRASARPGSRLEHLHLVSELAQFVGGGEASETGANHDDAHAFNLSLKVERRACLRFEQTEPRHRVVGERRPTDRGDTVQEVAACQRHEITRQV